MAKTVDPLLVANVRNGLSRNGQRELSSQYFYDAIGSSLFEVITLLPEYGLSRADERLLNRHTPELVRHLSSKLLVSELGCGTGTKTKGILSEISKRGPTTYLPIDISAAALQRCKIELEQIDGIEVKPLKHTYSEGLKQISLQRPNGMQVLLLFLGSTIGNFQRAEAVEFLGEIRNVLKTGDILLLATDLDKPIERFLTAYNDSLGVTAAFNLNILTRINRELDANFDLKQFKHVAVYNSEERRIEMYLQSQKEQEIRIPGADLTLTMLNGETIWTESSHKFNCEEVVEMAHQSSFECKTQWIDEEWPFAQNLLVAK